MNKNFEIGHISNYFEICISKEISKTQEKIFWF